jgi:hypothetical protein
MTITIGFVVIIVVGKIQWFAKLRDELLPTPKEKNLYANRIQPQRDLTPWPHVA